MNKKIFVPILCVVLVAGVLSGCVEEEPEPAENQAPTAGFTSVVVNQTVTFTDTSTDTDGNITSWSWDFGDGNTSTEQNPEHTYGEDNKTYTVTLTVTDDDGDTDEATDTVTIGTPNVAPEAGFDYVATNLSVNFTDNSTDSDGTIVSYLWDFGDGNTSNETNPTHEYATADTYTVTLTVTDDDGATDTETTEITVTE